MIKLIDILKEEINLDAISNAPSSKLPPGLSLISNRGTTRDVYEYNDKYVIKIAKNSKGISQNHQEVEVLTKYNSPLFPKLKKYDEKNDKYIVIEKVNDFKNEKSFYEFTYPNIDIIYKKVLSFFKKNPQYTSVNDLTIPRPKAYYYHIIIPYYLKQDIIGVTKEAKKRIWDETTKKAAGAPFSLDFFTQSTPDERIIIIPYKELTQFLDTPNTQELKKIYKQKIVQDLHWKNFGYQNNQLKILDLGL